MDDGSTPPLAPVVARFSDRLRITYTRVSNGGPAAARNHGAHDAKGRYLAFTDHDCLPAPEWLSALRDSLARNPESLLGGPKKNGLPNNCYSSAHQIASDYAERWFRSATGGDGYFTTNNLAVPREVFLDIGGFNESFPFAHEDRELEPAGPITASFAHGRRMPLSSITTSSLCRAFFASNSVTDPVRWISEPPAARQDSDRTSDFRGLDSTSACSPSLSGMLAGAVPCTGSAARGSAGGLPGRSLCPPVEYNDWIVSAFAMAQALSIVLALILSLLFILSFVGFGTLARVIIPGPKHPAEPFAICLSILVGAALFTWFFGWMIYFHQFTPFRAAVLLYSARPGSAACTVTRRRKAAGFREDP